MTAHKARSFPVSLSGLVTGLALFGLCAAALCVGSKTPGLAEQITPAMKYLSMGAAGLVTGFSNARGLAGKIQLNDATSDAVLNGTGTTQDLFAGAMADVLPQIKRVLVHTGVGILMGLAAAGICDATIWAPASKEPTKNTASLQAPYGDQARANLGQTKLALPQQTRS